MQRGSIRVGLIARVVYLRNDGVSVLLGWSDNQMMPFYASDRFVDFSSLRSVETVIIRFPGLLFRWSQAEGSSTIYRCIIARILWSKRRTALSGGWFFLQAVWFTGFAICSHPPSRRKRDCSRETREHIFFERFG